MNRRLALSLLLAAGTFAAGSSVAQVRPEASGSTLYAETDVWLWEAFPDVTVEDDLVSVWSADSGDRRYGVIEFDLSDLPDEPIRFVKLRLWTGTSVASIVQSAVAIDTTGGTPASALTWNAYQSEYDGTGTPLTSLGRVQFFPTGEEDINRFVDTVAGAGDIATLENLRQSGKSLTLILIADEDGTSYLQDWGDGSPGIGGMKAQLVVNSPDSIAAATDIWFWESFPDTTMEDDLVSVWSTASGDRRYGVVEFDLSELRDIPVQRARLRLWTGTLIAPIAQSAVAIDTTGGTPAAELTWNIYQSEYAGLGTALNSLGRVQFFPSGADDIDRFVDSFADPADVIFIENLRLTDDLLTLVLISDEDGTEYLQDWGDGSPGIGGMKAQLVVNEPDELFADDFETGDADDWSWTVDGSTDAELSVDPDTLFFLVEAGSCEESSFEVSNVGSERAFDIEVSDPFSPFSMTTDCPGELFPEQSCSVMVSFCPLEEDIYGGRIDIDYSDTKSDSTVTVMLNAEGIQP